MREIGRSIGLDVHRDFCEGAIARCGRERGPFSHAHSHLQTGSPGSGCEVAPDRWSAVAASSKPGFLSALEPLDDLEVAKMSPRT